MLSSKWAQTCSLPLTSGRTDDPEHKKELDEATKEKYRTGIGIRGITKGMPMHSPAQCLTKSTIAENCSVQGLTAKMYQPEIQIDGAKCNKGRQYT